MQPDIRCYHFLLSLARTCRAADHTLTPHLPTRHFVCLLQVLFDVLRYHGGAFEPSFWARIFDSVLLPIFDHVRAEVTDTTTFTSEKRRAQEDAWLYETCTRCLQHLVDLFGQFWDLVGPLFGRLLQLLASFISRSHASLASVGVAALTRAVEGCGPKMSADTWQEVRTGRTGRGGLEGSVSVLLYGRREGC